MTTTTERATFVREVADKFIAWIETAQSPDGLFAPGAFLDLTTPTWRLQADDVAELLAIRTTGHPWPGRVPRHRLDETASGFVLEWEEAWHDGGQDWYCREMCRAEVSPDGITQLSVYCTGDWDEARVAEHRTAVRLLRP